jgi:predicted HTH domain antitoxin
MGAIPLDHDGAADKPESLISWRTTTHYMHPTQVRLDRELKDGLERLAKRDRTTTSEALRRALKEGVRALLLREAVAGYIEKRLSLGGAAEVAGVSIAEMAAHLGDRGIPFYRYSAADLERDAKRARGWLG